MLPAQDDTRQEESVSTVSANLGSLAASKMFGPIEGLRDQLREISFEEIAAAEQQIAKLLEHLQSLQRVIEKIERMRACHVEVDYARAESAQLIEDALLQAERRPMPPQSLGNLAGLITLRGIGKPANQGQAIQATVTPIKARIVMAPTPPATEAPAEPRAADTPNDETPSADDGTLTAADSLARVEDRTDPVSSEISATTAAMAGEPTAANEAPAVAELSSAATPEAAPETDNEPVDFDQKLLDDLIKNYGEFVATPSAPAPAEPEPASASAEEKPRVTMHAVLGGRAGEKEPTGRTQNEIDRQLKKIVKDYGDVDLYAQSSNLKTKLRVGAAFIVLATVLGGIYYFSKPKGTDVPVADILQQRPAPAAAESLDKAANSDGIKDADTDRAGADNQALQKKFEKGGTKR